MAMLATFNLYLCRVNLSIAIVAMSKYNKSSSNNSSKHDSSSSTSDACNIFDDHGDNNNNNTNNQQNHHGEFDWSESTQSQILGAFFYGYLVFQIVGGRLAELFGAKWLCAAGMAVSLMINAMTPLIARTQIYWLLVASRVVLGMFQAFIFPALYALCSKWAPDHERSTFLSFLSIGSNVGTIATNALSGYLAEHGFAGGWPSVFYVSAIICSAWLLIWTVFIRSDPRDQPCITHRELQYIESNIDAIAAADAGDGDGSKLKKLPVPWLAIFRSKPIWSIIIVKWCMCWNYQLLLSKLPSYLKTVFKYPIEQNGFINSMVYVVLTISILLSGLVADFIVRKKLISKTLLRKIFESLAAFVSAICLAAIPWAQCNNTIVIALIMIGMIFFGTQAGGDIAIVSDMTNNFTATVFAIANTIAFTCGFITPLVIGYIVEASPGQPRRQWSYIFYMSAAISVLGGIVFLVFGSADRQPWDRDDVVVVVVDEEEVIVEDRHVVVEEVIDTNSVTKI
ncbi:putative inorganic phosphate cotransporter [Oppia nitens]|uniref:putative inorganic phosphate cotransporter n=1 Tax=Oppia nitens TaxID=1686743 RepID=UPI0023DC04F8|nr:putative inorganic phosphate cotransporter [Oppia nitens]